MSCARAGRGGGVRIRAVGVTTAASVNFRMGPGGEGYAIPINEAMSIANQIRSGTPSDTVHIGPSASLDADWESLWSSLTIDLGKP